MPDNINNYENNKIECNFYKQDALSLGKLLLGKILVRNKDGIVTAGKIVETEAYFGVNDKGSHAFGGKKTDRNSIMFEAGGVAYIYQIYGMYYCLNVVTGDKNHPEAVLIRALEPVSGIDLMKDRRNLKDSVIIKNLSNGPGKLCIAMDLDKTLNGISLCGDELFLSNPNEKEEFDIVETKRINIDYAEEAKNFLWRFYIKGNKYISKK